MIKKLIIEEAAIGLEIYKKNGIPYLLYNNRNYSFQDFLKLQEAKSIIIDIYEAIKKQYPQYVFNTYNMFQAVGKFIDDHFKTNDGITDVLILSNGDVVKFHFD